MKIYAMWTAQGRMLPNIGFMWHSVGLLSDVDFLFNERYGHGGGKVYACSSHPPRSRADHHRLFNVRYLLCATTGVTPGRLQVGEVVAGHSLFEWTSAEGYFALIQVPRCVDAWKWSRVELWHFQEGYVAGELHSLRVHPRMALASWEACEPDELFDTRPPQGSIKSSRGSVDLFEADVECSQRVGCAVMVRITYHPNFVVHMASPDATALHLPTYAVAPGYLAFRVPYGRHWYRVQYQSPLWSSCLKLLSLAWMLCSALGMLGILSLLLHRHSPSPASPRPPNKLEEEDLNKKTK
jgi:hypothetical protein